MNILLSRGQWETDGEDGQRERVQLLASVLYNTHPSRWTHTQHKWTLVYKLKTYTGTNTWDMLFMAVGSATKHTGRNKHINTK